MKISTTVEIEAPAAKVFYWLGDPERAVEWMTSVAGTEIIEKKPGWVGTTFRETVEEGGQSTELHGVVREYVENERMVFHLEGQYNEVDVVWTITERGDTTVVSQVAEVRFKGLVRIFSIVMAPAFRNKLTSQARQEFDKLKELCEGASAEL